MGPAANLLAQAQSESDPATKDGFIASATALIQTYVDGMAAAGTPVAGHMGARAIDVGTQGMSEFLVDQLRLTVAAIGGGIYLEPTTTGCWNQPKAGDPSTYGAASLSRQGALPGKGKCYNEHLHIDIPAGWAPPGSV